MSRGWLLESAGGFYWPFLAVCALFRVICSRVGASPLPQLRKPVSPPEHFVPAPVADVSQSGIKMVLLCPRSSMFPKATSVPLLPQMGHPLPRYSMSESDL